jgi:hypothetical protein
VQVRERVTATRRARRACSIAVRRVITQKSPDARPLENNNLIKFLSIRLVDGHEVYAGPDARRCRKMLLQQRNGNNVARMIIGARCTPTLVEFFPQL